LGGETLRFRIADDHPYQVGAGIEEKRECCRGLDSGIIVRPMHGDFSIDGTHVFAIAIKDGGDNSQLVDVFSVALVMGQSVEIDQRQDIQFGRGLVAADGLRLNLDRQVMNFGLRIKRVV
jgi:hypothetical protein